MGRFVPGGFDADRTDMQSRAILILSVFGLACVIVAGSMAIRLTSAAASTGAQDAMKTAAPEEAESESGSRAQPPSSGGGALIDEAANLDALTIAPAGISPEDAATADTLQKLLRRVHMHFEPEGAGIGTEMIPYLADMIGVINQHEHLVYRIVIVEPDSWLAERRVETLNDVLRLNVLIPANVHIKGRQGYQEALVEVSGS